MSTRILVPVDGSAAQLEAARFAGRRLRDETDAEVVLMHAVTLRPALLEHGGGRTAAESQRAENKTSRAMNDWLDEKRTALEESVFAPARAAVRKGSGREDAPRISIRVAGTLPEDAHATTFVIELAHGAFDAVVLAGSPAGDEDESAYGDLASELSAADVPCEIWLAG